MTIKHPCSGISPPASPPSKYSALSPCLLTSSLPPPVPSFSPHWSPIHIQPPNSNPMLPSEGLQHWNSIDSPEQHSNYPQDHCQLPQIIHKYTASTSLLCENEKKTRHKRHPAATEIPPRILWRTPPSPLTLCPPEVYVPFVTPTCPFVTGMGPFRMTTVKGERLRGPDSDRRRPGDGVQSLGERALGIHEYVTLSGHPGWSPWQPTPERQVT